MERPRRGSFSRNKGALLPANIYAEAAGGSKVSLFFVGKPDKEVPWPVDANGLFHLIGSSCVQRMSEF